MTNIYSLARLRLAVDAGRMIKRAEKLGLYAFAKVMRSQLDCGLTLYDEGKRSAQSLRETYWAPTLASLNRIERDTLQATARKQAA